MVDRHREHADHVRRAGTDDRRAQDPTREPLDVDDQAAVGDVVGIATIEVGVVDHDAPT